MGIVCQSGVHPPTRASGDIIVKDLAGVSTQNILQNQKGHHDSQRFEGVWGSLVVFFYCRHGGESREAGHKVHLGVLQQLQ